MNMFQLQERIKDFSKDQLVREMQQPSGAVPPFLVLSELQRRTRMEKAFQAEQAQGQQSTVAQDAIAAAGVPQGGIADMARAMAPQTDMAGNTGAMPVQNMYGGGEVKRMEPGGEVEGFYTALLRQRRGIQNTTAEMQARNAIVREKLRRMQAAAGTLADEDGEGLSEVSADVGSFAPGALGGFGIGGTAPDSLSRVDPNVAAPRTAPGLPSIRPTDAQPVLNELAPPAFRDIAAPATILGPEQGPNLPSMEDAARMRAINVTPGASGFPPQSDLDMRFAQEQRELAAEMAAAAGQTPDPTSIIMSDGVMSPIDDRPTPIADAFRAELASRDARAAEAARMMEINEIPAPADPSLMDRLVNSELGRTLAAGSGVALPQLDEDPAASTSALLEDVARTFAFPTLLEAGEDLMRQPDADTPRPVPRPDRSTTPPDGPRTSGTGGAGARSTGTADADKWLALAQFGLGLMASQAPTLGGAIGEAGTAALSQLRESQKEAYERDLAERTLAARSASRLDRLSLSDRLDYITDQMENVRLAISMEPDAGRKMDLANDLASLQEQAAAILGTSGPATARAAEGATDVRG
jgi:hypothetical protein